MEKRRKVSLSGKTRLTYREAFMLADAARRGEFEIDSLKENNDPYYRTCHVKALEKAIDKLEAAVLISGGYDEQGEMIDPFPAPRPRKRKDGLRQTSLLDLENEDGT